MAKICFKISSKTDYLRLLGMMEKTEAICWIGGGPVLRCIEFYMKLPVKYVILRIPSFQISYSNNSDYTLSCTRMIDSRQVLSMRFDDKNKFRIYLSPKRN